MPPRRARPAIADAGTARRTGRPAAVAHDPAAEPLHRGALHLLRLLRREDAAARLSPARLSALSVLVFGGPCSLGALAAAEGVSAPTMSRLVAGLERERWIVRAPDDADARATRLEASAAARRLLLDGRDRRLAALSSALASVPAADRAMLTRALPALDRLVRVLATRTAAPRDAARDAARHAKRAPTRRRRFD